MIYDLMDDHIKYNTWLLENIYFHLGKNIVNNTDLQYEEILIYRAKIPDFIKELRYF